MPKITTGFPKELSETGVGQVSRAALRNPDAAVTCLVRVSTRSITRTIGTGALDAAMQITHIELIPADAEDIALQLVEEAVRDRLGGFAAHEEIKRTLEPWRPPEENNDPPLFEMNTPSTLAEIDFTQPRHTEEETK